MHSGVKLRHGSANGGYHLMKSMLFSEFFSRETKTKLYITYLRLIIMCARKTGSTIKGDEIKLLIIFEWKILRKRYGPTLNRESKNYERKKNEEIESIFNILNI